MWTALLVVHCESVSVLGNGLVKRRNRERNLIELIPGGVCVCVHMEIHAYVAAEK